MSINEIEKQFFELFEIKKLCDRKTYELWKTYKLCVGSINCDECSSPYYPRITSDMLLRIIETLSLQGSIIIENWKEKGFNVTFRAFSNLRYVTFLSVTRETIKDCILQICIDILTDNDMTEDEKKQIQQIFE